MENTLWTSLFPRKLSRNFIFFLSIFIIFFFSKFFIFLSIFLYLLFLLIENLSLSIIFYFFFVSFFILPTTQKYKIFYFAIEYLFMFFVPAAILLSATTISNESSDSCASNTQLFCYFLHFIVLCFPYILKRR